MIAADWLADVPFYGGECGDECEPCGEDEACGFGARDIADEHSGTDSEEGESI